MATTTEQSNSSTLLLPPAEPARADDLPPPVQRAFGFALLVSALRCTVQYVVLPFVLPLVGITAPVPRWVTLALSVVALLSLVRAVRQLWRMHYPGFWRYLLLAGVVGGALLVFVATDLQGSPG